MAATPGTIHVPDPVVERTRRPVAMIGRGTTALVVLLIMLVAIVIAWALVNP